MKKVLKIIGFVLCGIICVPLIALLVSGIRTKLTQNDYSSVYTDPKYEKALSSDR